MNEYEVDVEVTLQVYIKTYSVYADDETHAKDKARYMAESDFYRLCDDYKIQCVAETLTITQKEANG